MESQTFHKIWYLPAENRWQDMNLLAMRDVGTLVIEDQALEFHGKLEALKITSIRHDPAGHHVMGGVCVLLWQRQSTAL